MSFGKAYISIDVFLLHVNPNADKSGLERVLIK